MNILDSLKKYFYKNGSSEASSDARVPLLTATGEPKGSDTMANLASVLGVGINTLQAGANLNDMRTTNMYVCYDGATSSTILNKPANVAYGFLLEVKPCPNAPTNVVQILWADGGRMFSRNYDNSWSDWLTYSYDIPSFYKNYQDIVSLTSGVKRAMKVSQKTLVVPANGSNSELGLQANPFTVIKADTSNFNGCIVLLCDHAGFMVLGNYGGFNDWVTLSASGGSLVIQNKTGVQLTLPVFTFVG